MQGSINSNSSDTNDAVVANTARPAFMAMEETPPKPPPSVTPSVVTGNTTSGEDGESKGGNKKLIAGILGVAVLVAGIGAGVFALTRSQQLEPASAWDCEKYNFYVSRTGQTTAVNGSTRNEPIQKVQIKIDGVLAGTFDIPALTPGQSANLGTVATPLSGIFTWEATGTIDCRDGGSYAVEPTPTSAPAAACSSIKAYDDEWNELSTFQLTALKTGDKVRFVASGISTTGTFDKARFTINGTQRAEVTIKKPGTSDFYDEYIIPASTVTFNVTAQVHHKELDLWF